MRRQLDVSFAPTITRSLDLFVRFRSFFCLGGFSGKADMCHRKTSSENSTRMSYANVLHVRCSKPCVCAMITFEWSGFRIHSLGLTKRPSYFIPIIVRAYRTRHRFSNVSHLFLIDICVYYNFLVFIFTSEQPYRGWLSLSHS